LAYQLLWPWGNIRTCLGFPRPFVFRLGSVQDKQKDGQTDREHRKKNSSMKCNEAIEKIVPTFLYLWLFLCSSWRHLSANGSHSFGKGNNECRNSNNSTNKEWILYSRPILWLFQADEYIPDADTVSQWYLPCVRSGTDIDAGRATEVRRVSREVRIVQDRCSLQQ